MWITWTGSVVSVAMTDGTSSTVRATREPAVWSQPVQSADELPSSSSQDLPPQPVIARRSTRPTPSGVVSSPASW